MNKNLLYAEDDPKVRETMTMAFGFILPGVRVEAVKNGRDLVERYKTGQYDVIVTDGDMDPGIHGLEAMEEIRAYENQVGRNPTPAIFYSGRITPDVSERCSKIGGVEALAKPADLSVIKSKVMTALQIS